MIDYGARFMIGINGKTIDDDIDILKEINPGGIILFTRNIGSPNQIRKLTKSIYKYYKDNDLLTPFIAVDQEGGTVVRLTNGMPVFPSNMAVCKTGDENNAYLAAYYTGKYLKYYGINLNLAPVLDVNRNSQNPGIGVRSFSEYTDRVSLFGTSAVKGYQDSGCLCCGKHFPGKGKASVDAHINMPSIDISEEELIDFDIEPFRKAVKYKIPFIMSSHFVVNSIDPNNPATFSIKVIRGLLKDKLKYRGIVLSDCLEMGAMQKNYNVNDIVRGILNSGTDIYLISHTKSLQREIFSIYKKLVNSDKLLKKENVKIINKINRDRKKINNLYVKPRDNKKPSLLIRRIIKDSIRIIGGDKNLPIKIEDFKNTTIFIPSKLSLTGVEDSRTDLRRLIGYIKKYHSKINIIKYDPITAECDRTAAADKNGILVFLSYNAHLYKKQIKLINKFKNKYKLSVLIAVRNPYDLETVKGFDIKSATYNPDIRSIKAVLRKILM